jgi:hypothetical protein
MNWYGHCCFAGSFFSLQSSMFANRTILSVCALLSLAQPTAHAGRNTLHRISENGRPPNAQSVNGRNTWRHAVLDRAIDLLQRRGRVYGTGAYLRQSDRRDVSQCITEAAAAVLMEAGLTIYPQTVTRVENQIAQRIGAKHRSTLTTAATEALEAMYPLYITDKRASVENKLKLVLALDHTHARIRHAIEVAPAEDTIEDPVVALARRAVLVTAKVLVQDHPDLLALAGFEPDFEKHVNHVYGKIDDELSGADQITQAARLAIQEVGGNPGKGTLLRYADKAPPQIRSHSAQDDLESFAGWISTRGRLVTYMRKRYGLRPAQPGEEHVTLLGGMATDVVNGMIRERYAGRAELNLQLSTLDDWTFLLTAELQSDLEEFGFEGIDLVQETAVLALRQIPKIYQLTWIGPFVPTPAPNLR